MVLGRVPGGLGARAFLKVLEKTRGGGCRRGSPRSTPGPTSTARNFAPGRTFQKRRSNRDSRTARPRVDWRGKNLAGQFPSRPEARPVNILMGPDAIKPI